ncbi:hypothetical protein KY348_05185 [Candidatus Woesearchaeota archaeon]|nr:hypothetical protein [Candidatus Woesearchaeota archaeon]
MITTKRFLIILCLVFFFLTGISLVLGVSVRPGRIVIPFEPNGVFKGTVYFGTGGRTPHLGISSSGEFEVIIDKTELYCNKEPCSVNYTVIMPESFDTPGLHRAKIKAGEIFDEKREGMIITVVGISMLIDVEVPYPGKYLKFNSFKAVNKEAGEEIPFTAVLVSKGDQVINSAKGVINIYNRFDEIIGTISTNTLINIQPGDKIELTAGWDSGTYEKGHYHSFIDVIYDGLKTNKTTSFKLGGLDVELVNYTKEIIIGGIKPLDLFVESLWSERISNLKAKVTVLDNESKELTSFETLTVSLPAWKSTVLKGYLDTEMLDINDYNIRITLLFEDIAKDYDRLISIIEPPGEKEKKSIFTAKNVLIASAILLIIILLIVYLVISKKKFKKEEDKK